MCLIELPWYKSATQGKPDNIVVAGYKTYFLFIQYYTLKNIYAALNLYVNQTIEKDGFYQYFRVNQTTIYETN
jgi:hypothetical protein